MLQNAKTQMSFYCLNYFDFNNLEKSCYICIYEDYNWHEVVED